MSCDEVFALYLSLVATKVNDVYYRSVIRFILHYRDCLNQYGWEKRAENDDP